MLPFTAEQLQLGVMFQAHVSHKAPSMMARLSLVGFVVTRHKTLQYDTTTAHGSIVSKSVFSMRDALTSYCAPAQSILTMYATTADEMRYSASVREIHRRNGRLW
jgi:hypothetical protein